MYSRALTPMPMPLYALLRPPFPDGDGVACRTTNNNKCYLKTSMTRTGFWIVYVSVASFLFLLLRSFLEY